MNDEIAQARLDGLRIGIAACKAEIDEIPGLVAAIEMHDDGSPWGRAFLKGCSKLKEMGEHEERYG